MAWIFKSRTETVNEFLQHARPTKTSTSTATWISCDNERGEDVEPAASGHSDEKGNSSSNPVQVDLTRGSETVLVDLTEQSEFDDDSLVEAKRRGYAILQRLVRDLRRPGGRTEKSLRDQAVEDLKQVAVECGLTTGKWLIFPTFAEVDNMWAKVATATVEGRLGDAAKVSACQENAVSQRSTIMPVICVYTNDFRKVDKVKQMLEYLIDLGMKPRCFKLDLFTYLDIDSKSRAVYGIPTGIYTPKSILEPVIMSTNISPSRKCKPFIDLINDAN